MDLKKYISVFLCIICAIVCFSGCSGRNSTLATDKLKVVTTIFPPYDIVRGIGGEKVELTMLIEPGNEVHTFEPTPQDIIKISECDLFIYNGGESDEWVKTILSGLDEDIDTLSFMSVMGYSNIDKAHHDHAYDEHVWTSPKNVIKISEAIKNKLIEIDEKNKNYYEENADKYINELETLDKTFSEIVSNGKRKTLIFGDRFPLKHFAESYGLECHSAFPGCAEDTEPSAATLSELIERVKADGIPVVFKTELSSDKIAKTICEATNTTIRTFHTCHNLTVEEFESGVTYLELMNENAGVLKEALY